jgi:HlyD family secretion protein
MSKSIQDAISKWRAPPTERSRDDTSGEVFIGTLIIGGFAVLFFVWAALTPLDAAVVADGVIVVSGNKQTVQHRDGGVVSRLLVREGQHVSQGVVLIELGAPELIAQERITLAQMLDLQARAASLEVETGQAEIMRAPEEWAALPVADQALAQRIFGRYDNNGAAFSETSARIVGMRRQITALSQQEALVQDELNSMQPLLAQRLVPLTRVRSLERSLADLRGQRGNLSAQIDGAEQGRIEELRRTEAQLAEIIPQVIAARAELERTRLRAPVTGAVLGLTIHTIGGVVRPGEPVMDIVPDRQGLVVEARIRPEDADDLRIGESAEVRITAFSARDLPLVVGSVQQISADRFEDQRTGQGYYLAQIEVPHDDLEALTASGGAERRLRPGMPAQVVVSTRKRTALQFLTEPLSQMLWRSFRQN